MEENNIIVNSTYLTSDFRHLRLLQSGPGETSNSTPHRPHIHNPKKKRTIRNNKNDTTTATRVIIPNPKPTKKPDPTVPQITRPCTECGRRFWSWKALFGHMRCHPERQWRGIIPPPEFRRIQEITYYADADDSSSVTSEDHEVAACLLMLSSGPQAGPASDNTAAATACTANYRIGSAAAAEYSDGHHQNDAIINCGRFECSSCKKVFGSRQALGGHRASHKKVKGCYAINKSIDVDGEEESEEGPGCCCSGDHNQQISAKENININNNNQFKCRICFRVFPNGQALGGHMRCHWEKVDEPIASVRVFGYDLNSSAAPVDQDDDDDDDFASSSGLALDLRLGL